MKTATDVTDLERTAHRWEGAHSGAQMSDSDIRPAGPVRRGIKRRLAGAWRHGPRSLVRVACIWRMGIAIPIGRWDWLVVRFGCPFLLVLDAPAAFLHSPRPTHVGRRMTHTHVLPCSSHRARRIGASHSALPHPRALPPPRTPARSVTALHLAGRTKYSISYTRTGRPGPSRRLRIRPSVRDLKKAPANRVVDHLADVASCLCQQHFDR